MNVQSNVSCCRTAGVALLLASLVLSGCHDRPATARAAAANHATSLPSSLPAVLPPAVAAAVPSSETAAVPSDGFNRQYPWLAVYNGRDTIQARFIPPHGYERASVLAGTFARWLRHLPLRVNEGHLASAPVYAGVIDIDLDGSGPSGGGILAIARLRAEYLLASDQPELIRFGAGSGKWLSWLPPESATSSAASAPAKGPARADATTYAAFRRYLADVRGQMTASSFTKSLVQVTDLHQVRLGDVYVRTSGEPWAAIVVDTALRPSDGHRVFLLAQVAKGGREMVILFNAKGELGPWFEAESNEPIQTSLGSFNRDMLRRFRAGQADDASQPTTNSAASKAADKPTLAGSSGHAVTGKANNAGKNKTR